MKVITQEARPEKADFYCDKCGGDCYPSATIHFGFGYGSQQDGDYGDLHFCETCCGVAEQLAKRFSEEFKSFSLRTHPWAL